MKNVHNSGTMSHRQNGSGNMNSHNNNSTRKTNITIGKAAFLTLSLATVTLIFQLDFKNLGNIFFGTPNIHSESFFNGDTLEVIAKDGTKIRQHPSSQSKPIAYIPFGASVIYEGEKSNLTNTYIVNGEEITEFWVKVTYQSKTGWMFAGGIARNSSIAFAPTYDDDSDDSGSNSNGYDLVTFEPSFKMKAIGSNISFRGRPIQDNKKPAGGYLQKGEMVEVIARTEWTDKVEFRGKIHEGYWYECIRKIGKKYYKGFVHEVCLGKVLAPNTGTKSLEEDKEILSSPVIEKLTPKSVKEYETVVQLQPKSEKPLLLPERPQYKTDQIEVSISNGLSLRTLVSKFNISVGDDVGTLKYKVTVGASGVVLVSELMSSKVSSTNLQQKVTAQIEEMRFTKRVNASKETGVVTIRILDK